MLYKRCVKGTVCLWITVYSSCLGAPSLASSVCQDGPIEPLYYTHTQGSFQVGETQRHRHIQREAKNPKHTLQIVLTEHVNVEQAVCATKDQ